MTLIRLLPPGWPPPRGYAHGLMGEGRLVVIGGQVGCDAEGRFARGFVAQARRALENLLAVLAEAGGGPEHIARLGWFVTDMRAYRASLQELGLAYRAVMGRCFPAMTLVEVGALVEEEALVEIEATAILPRG
ncbi:MAG: RidA family protein [Roseococcus sp.]|nr:RidA family protein [Roseococcus sp.]